MKKLIALLILVAGGYLVYQYLQQGEVEILDQGEPTAAEIELGQLEEQFKTLKDRYEQGDLSAVEVEAARTEAEEIRDKLKKITPELTKSRDKAKVGQLGLEIKKFKDEVL